MSKNFALLGVGGFVAPRHLQAIKSTGNELLAACDPSDSVGVLDKYFLKTKFFTEVERFDRFLDKQKRCGEEQRVHYLSICTPNYLHDAHVRLALRVGADAICEKPLVINPWNLDQLEEIEHETGRRVYTVLQLRLLPAMQELKKRLLSKKKRANVVLSYIARRGPWYQISWKGDESKSGGLSLNIGVHFFDLLLWLFGPVEQSEVHLREQQQVAGSLRLRDADVHWFLSTRTEDLPAGSVEQGKTAFRSLTIDGEETEFSTGFSDLHTAIYKEILEGRGFGVRDARPSVELVHRIRNAPLKPTSSNKHPAFR